MRRAGCLALLLAAVALPGAGSAAPTAESALLLYDPSSRTLTTVELGAAPLRVSFAEGAFWVVAHDEGAVLRVDARTRQVRRIAVGDEPYDALVRDDVLWVPDHDEGNLHRVDLSTGDVTDSRPFGAPALAVGYGFGAVWLQLAGQRLLRIDPATLRPTATIRNGARSREGLEPEIEVTRDAVWVAGASGPELLRVNPARRRVTRRIQRAGRGVAAGAGAIWSGTATAASSAFADGGRRESEWARCPPVWRYSARRSG